MAAICCALLFLSLDNGLRDEMVKCAVMENVGATLVKCFISFAWIWIRIWFWIYNLLANLIICCWFSCEPSYVESVFIFMPLNVFIFYLWEGNRQIVFVFIAILIIAFS